MRYMANKYHVLTLLGFINLILYIINTFYLIYLVSFVEYHCINDDYISFFFICSKFIINIQFIIFS